MNSDGQHTLENITMEDVARAFIAGCREARANPMAGEFNFERAADAYVKLMIEEAASVR